MADWNPWHGCQKISDGCLNCYVYSSDARHGRDSSLCTKNTSFNMPVKRSRNGEYKIPGGEMVWTCFTSDFFLNSADQWRDEAWRMIRERHDLSFFMITKRIDRAEKCFPSDWDDFENGYPNVTICCTCENQKMADYRLPIYLSLPIQNKEIICSPLLEKIDLRKYISSGEIKRVTCAGESGMNARLCRYEWILNIREQCIENKVNFHFQQTGANFEKDGKRYIIPRRHQHSQARKAKLELHYK